MPGQHYHMSNAIIRKLEDARRRIMNRHTFFAGPMLSLEFEIDDVVPTAGTNGVKIKFNPDFVDSLSLDQVVGLIVHELLHCLLLHPWRFRREYYHPMVSNAACDYAINGWIQEYSKASKEAIELPPDGCINFEKYGHMAEELIYNKLMAEAPPRGREGGEGEGKRKAYSPGEFEQASATDKAVDEKGRSLPDKWQEILATTLHEAKLRGSLPGSFIEKMSARLNKEVDWAKLLQNHLTEIADTDFSDQFPDRQYLEAYDVCMPMLRTEAPGHLVFIVDTSGSMSSEILNRAYGKVVAAMKTLRIPKLTFMQVDSRVSDVQTLTYNDKLPAVKGRGGTDFRPAFDYIDKHLRSVRCAIYLTDGCGPFPAKRPKYPVIWVDYEGSNYPWGKVVRVHNKTNN